MDKIFKIKQIAISRGGFCLSDIYINNRELLLFQCDKNHQWKTTWKCINKGAWCPRCSVINSTGKNNKRFNSIENMQLIAEARGGKCLSKEYFGAHVKLIWQCNLEHIWETKPNAIKNGTWCPKCSEGIGERACRFIFESIFKEKFIKIRPNWLLNLETERNLELDGFCEKLGIAFEYNGNQHYSDNTFYPKSKYDLYKIQKCQSNNIKLFIIKQISNINNYLNIIDDIKIQAINFNINLPVIINLNINEVYKNNVSENFLNDLKVIAQLKGGECLSTNYIDNSFKLDFKCGKCNYIWKASPNAIKSGTWCPNCANKNISLINAIDLASKNNGKCNSFKYINSITKMDWECNLGHKWKTTYNQIQSGEWCPECFKANRGKSKILKIDIYKNAAINKGGICISNVVNSCYDKLEWKCSNDHIWFARGDAIKNTKQWCPKCAVINKRKIK